MFDHIDDPEILKEAGGLAANLSVDIEKLAAEAIPVDKSNPVKFPDEEFALKVQSPSTGEKSRHLPMSDEANTLLSTISFLLKGKMMPEDTRQRTAARLAERLQELGHTDHARVLMEYGSGAEPKDTEDGDAFKKPVVKGPHQKMRVGGQEIELKNKQDIEAVASDVDADLHHLTPIDRRAAALQLFALGADLPERVAPYAGMEKNASLGQFMNWRYDMIPEANHGLALDRIDDILRTQSLEEQIAKIAVFDATFGPFAQVPDAVLSAAAVRRTAPEPEKFEYTEQVLSKVAALLGDDVSTALKDGNEANLSPDAMAIVNRLLQEVV